MKRIASLGFPVVVVANVLIFSLPFEAMAESCEPDIISSFNMPLLLGIALIGAAVGVGRIPEKEVIVDSRKALLTSNLKAGKNFLRNQEPEKAFKEFKAALELAQRVGDPIEEKKAARGLGASLQRQGKYRDAIKYHSMVLVISEREREDSGNSEAYGAIADCYTELGDLERAGKFYDKYIARLQTD